MSDYNEHERETIITTSDGETHVRIETFQRSYLGKLRRDDRFTELTDGTDPGHGVFSIERSKWTPTSGAKRKVNLTDERRAELQARAKANFGNN